MSLKRTLEKLLRKNVARHFSKLNEFETQKFMHESAQILTDEANARGFDDSQRHQLLYQIQRTLYPKFVIADEGRMILDNQEFRKIFEKFSNENWTSFERKWNLKELLKLTHQVPGDLAECGVFRGGSAYFMCLVAAKFDKSVHLFDSFEGLSNPDEKEDFHWSQGDLAIPEDQVNNNLAEFKNFKTYKGWIPERFDEVANKQFSFVHVDVDLEQPTRDSIAFFYPRLSPGGVLLLDDHGSAMCPGARKAALDYFDNNSEEVLDLATGQGLVIKQAS